MLFRRDPITAVGNEPWRLVSVNGGRDLPPPLEAGRPSWQGGRDNANMSREKRSLTSIVLTKTAECVRSVVIETPRLILLNG